MGVKYNIGEQGRFLCIFEIDQCYLSISCWPLTSRIFACLPKHNFDVSCVRNLSVVWYIGHDVADGHKGFHKDGIWSWHTHRSFQHPSFMNVKFLLFFFYTKMLLRILFISQDMVGNRKLCDCSCFMYVHNFCLWPLLPVCTYFWDAILKNCDSYVWTHNKDISFCLLPLSFPCQDTRSPYFWGSTEKIF